MTRRSLFSVADHVLVNDLDAAIARDRAATAEMLDLIAEVDSRKLYAPAGYPSMYQYLVGKLHMSEDVALKRLDAARAARQLPAIFDAVAEGRLNLSGLMLMLPHLKNANARTAEALLAAAKHQTNAEIRVLLAERFPAPDVPTSIRAIAPSAGCRGLVPQADCESGSELSLEKVCEQRELVAVRRPCEPGLTQESGDVCPHAMHLDSNPVRETRALDELILKLEKQRFAATSHPRPRRGTPKGRHIPAEVKRAVAERDGGQCTFVSDQGLRCCATSNLEFDHIDPVARGGKSTMAGLRLRCRTHNQYTAELTFGAGFMREKRQATHHCAAETRALKSVAAAAQDAAPAPSRPEGGRPCAVLAAQGGGAHPEASAFPPFSAAVR